MSWKHVAVTAVIALVVVAIAMQVPGLRDFYKPRTA